MRFIDVFTLSVSVCSLISSALYTYVYIVGQQATFFNQVHSEYAKSEMSQAFDVLEGLLDATGPKSYASEYVRLKGLQRERYKQDKESGRENLLIRAFVPSQQGQPNEAQIGQILDKSRRRILHYFGMLLSLHRMGYITNVMMLEFPGRSRALHAVQLIQPLVEETYNAFNFPGLQEHFRVLDEIRNAYNISRSEASVYSLQGEQFCTGGECYEDSRSSSKSAEEL